MAHRHHVDCRGESGWRSPSAAKHLQLWGLLLAALALFGIVLGSDARSRHSVWVGEGNGRRLQPAVQTVAEDQAPTLDDYDTVIFSRPPYSEQDKSDIAYYSVAGIYFFCAIIMLVGANLDQVERRRRIARSIVPHEVEPYQLCCFKMVAHKESVPCEITEQYYLDSRLLNLRSPAYIAERRNRLNFWGYAWRYTSVFFNTLAREHLLMSFLLRVIPTFTRVKRGFLIVLQFNVCMLTAAIAVNIREHDAPRGKYEIFSCGESADSQCFSTLPAAFLASAICCPIFRLAAFRQMRLTCFVPQTHPTGSRFPLGTRKFATIRPRSLLEAVLCMRSGMERAKERATVSRTFVHRVVQLLWKTSIAIHELRFHSITTSWLILIFFFLIVVATIAYVLAITVYLKDEVVYHWLAWTLTMFFFSVLVLEPLWIFWTDVVWSALVASAAQHWGFGSHALAATTKYREVVRQVEGVYVSDMQTVAATRIQHWWLAVLDMYRAIHEQTAAAIKIQAIGKKMHQKKKYVKERKWCLKVESLSCDGLVDPTVGDEEMSPFIRLMCDVGNPNVLQTNVMWNSGVVATFEEKFFIDIKESSAMYVSVWSKELTNEDFIGRGCFDFKELKTGSTDTPQAHILKVPLQDIQHGERPKEGGECKGWVNLKVHFLDPLKDDCNPLPGQEDWMLPKNRMRIALSQMNPGGRLQVGKMLGSLPASKPPTTIQQQYMVSAGESPAGSGGVSPMHTRPEKPPGSFDDLGGVQARPAVYGRKAVVGGEVATGPGKAQFVVSDQEDSGKVSLPAGSRAQASFSIQQGSSVGRLAPGSEATSQVASTNQNLPAGAGAYAFLADEPAGGRGSSQASGAGMGNQGIGIGAASGANVVGIGAAAGMGIGAAAGGRGSSQASGAGMGNQGTGIGAASGANVVGIGAAAGMGIGAAAGVGIGAFASAVSGGADREQVQTSPFSGAVQASGAGMGNQGIGIGAASGANLVGIGAAAGMGSGAAAGVGIGASASAASGGADRDQVHMPPLPGAVQEEFGDLDVDLVPETLNADALQRLDDPEESDVLNTDALLKLEESGDLNDNAFNTLWAEVEQGEQGEYGGMLRQPVREQGEHQAMLQQPVREQGEYGAILQQPVREQGEFGVVISPGDAYAQEQAARTEAERVEEARALAVEVAAMRKAEEVKQREEAAAIGAFAFSLPRPKTADAPPPEPAVDVAKLEAELQDMLTGQGQGGAGIEVHRTNRPNVGPVRTDVAMGSGWRPGSGAQARSPTSQPRSPPSVRSPHGPPPAGAAPSPPLPGPPPGPAPPGPPTG